jgi:hypothetical protein
MIKSLILKRFSRQSGGLILAVIWISGCAVGHAQSLDHPKVFNPRTLSQKKVREAQVTLPTGMAAHTKEVYRFDTTGRLLWVTALHGDTTDTLLHHGRENHLTKSVTESNATRTAHTLLYYDSLQRVVTKQNYLSGTLTSVVHLRYGKDGMLEQSVEVDPGGDTLTTATYHYQHGRVVLITYTGTSISKITITHHPGKTITAVYHPNGTLKITTIETFRRDGLLKTSTVSVTGIQLVPTTRYHYRAGLLRSVRHPVGTRSEVRYFRANTINAHV